jgi:hypothetical protein
VEEGDLGDNRFIDYPPNHTLSPVQTLVRRDFFYALENFLSVRMASDRESNPNIGFLPKPYNH